MGLMVSVTGKTNKSSYVLGEEVVITGQVKGFMGMRGLANLTVNLIRNGAVAKQAVSDPSGDFTFRDTTNPWTSQGETEESILQNGIIYGLEVWRWMIAYDNVQLPTVEVTE